MAFQIFWGMLHRMILRLLAKSLKKTMGLLLMKHLSEILKSTEAQRAKSSMIWLAQQQYGRLALAGNSLTLKKNKINDMPAQLSRALLS